MTEPQKPSLIGFLFILAAGMILFNILAGSVTTTGMPMTYVKAFHYGMQPQELVKILGKPENIQAYGEEESFVHYYYGNGTFHFKKDKDGIWKMYRWEVPVVIAEDKVESIK